MQEENFQIDRRAAEGNAVAPQPGPASQEPEEQVNEAQLPQEELMRQY